MRILITGGSGFIGTHLARDLAGRGHEVCVLDLTAPRIAVDDVDYVLGDVRNKKDLLHRLKGVDAVYHLAAIVSVPLCQADPIESYRTNTLATAMLLDCVCEEMERTHRPIRVFFSSTSAVYGNLSQRVPIQEDGVSCLPISFYGAQKLASETAIRMFHCHHGVPAMIFRLFNVYGPGQRSDSSYSGVITLFRDAAEKNGVLELHGDGSQVRDFVAIQDVVRAFSQALVLGIDRFTAEPINIGSGRPISIRELALLVGAFAGRSLDLRQVGKRSGDIDYSCANVALAAKNLGWEVQVGLTEGLKDLFIESESAWVRPRQRAFSVVGDSIRN